MYPTLRDFVDVLDAEGELRRIDRPVSPILDIAAVAHLAGKSPAPHAPSPSALVDDPLHARLGGPALLFERVAGSDIPVLINAFGSYRRMEMALACEGAGFAAIADRIAHLARPQPPRSIADALALLRRFAPLLRVAPRRVRHALCQEVVRAGDDADLRDLPLIRCWPLDADLASVACPPAINDDIPGALSGPEWDRLFRGRYVTLAGVHTIHADDADAQRPASHNVGMYRFQLLGPRLLAFHCHMHHDGAAHWRSWKAANKPMPIALALGGESVLPYAATCPLPPGISELLMAGFLQSRPIDMVRARTIPLWVPANAEIIIEGFVSHEGGFPGWDPRTPLGPGAALEGPFGDHTGFYSLPDRYPLLHVTAVTHRRNPIYPATVVGPPPQEDYFMGKATERIMLPLLRTLIPDIDDYDLPIFGAFHNCAALSLRKHYPLHARRLMHAVWGAGQMSWTKCVIVADRGADIHDYRAVLRDVARRCNPLRDIERVRGPLDILDHAAPMLGAGAKLGLDATTKLPQERAGDPHADHPFPDPESPPSLALLDALRAIPGVLDARLPSDLHGWLFVRIDKATGDRNVPALARRVIAGLRAVLDDPARPPARPPAYTILVGRECDLRDDADVLFHWLAHADPARDLETWSSRGHASAAFESAPKAPGDERDGHAVRDWPPPLRFDDGTLARARDVL